MRMLCLLAATLPLLVLHPAPPPVSVLAGWLPPSVGAAARSALIAASARGAADAPEVAQGMRRLLLGRQLAGCDEQPLLPVVMAPARIYGQYSVTDGVTRDRPVLVLVCD